MSIRSSRSALRTRVAAIGIALGTAVATIALAPGTANASRAYALRDCINISPNIVDVPYMPSRVIVSEYAGQTYLAIDYTSAWIGVGYTSASRLDWRNLTSNAHGTVFQTNRVSPPYSGVHNFTIPTSKLGPGKVKVTLSTVNSNALWSIPARSCTGTILTP